MNERGLWRHADLFDCVCLLLVVGGLYAGQVLAKYSLQKLRADVESARVTHVCDYCNPQPKPESNVK